MNCEKGLGLDDVLCSRSTKNMFTENSIVHMTLHAHPCRTGTTSRQAARVEFESNSIAAVD